MSKVLALALLLLLSLQILTWNGRPLMQLPCPFPSVISSPLNKTTPNPNLDEASSSTQADDLPALAPNCTQVENQLTQTKNQLTQTKDQLKLTKDLLKQTENELELTKGKLKLAKDQLPVASSPSLPPNSYFPDADSDMWACRRHHVDELNMTYHDWVTGDFTDEQALCAAHRHAKRPMAPGTPRIAFLFLTRGEIPTEPLWRKFFAGHEDKYSIYVHSTDPDHVYAPGSLFRGRSVPSKPLESKVKIGLPEAMRRLLAYALLDYTTPNAWFHILSESSVPIRSFPFAYDYITNSDKSFVEAFFATSPWWHANWNTTGDMAVPEDLMRKGEAWFTVHRRHAGMIVGDHYVFPRFKHHWFEWGMPSEIYIPTLMSVADPQSIANHSLVYVNWRDAVPGASSPFTYDHTTVSPDVIRGIQSLTSNAHGFYQFDKIWNDTTENSCVYNGVPDSPCFLFARKFSGDAENIAKLVSLSPVLGYG
jgi:hypothetical protein